MVDNILPTDLAERRISKRVPLGVLEALMRNINDLWLTKCKLPQQRWSE